MVIVFSQNQVQYSDCTTSHQPCNSTYHFQNSIHAFYENNALTCEQSAQYKKITLYSYTLEADQDPVKNGQFTIPFTTQFPGLVFNIQLGSLEVIGDWWSNSNKNHQMMTTAGSFSDASGSLFDGHDFFEVCYSQNAGTLVFSGWGHGGATQVYIITQNSNWNQVESSDKYLSSFQNPSSTVLVE